MEKRQPVTLLGKLDDVQPEVKRRFRPDIKTEDRMPVSRERGPKIWWDSEMRKEVTRRLDNCRCVFVSLHYLLFRYDCLADMPIEMP